MVAILASAYLALPAATTFSGEIVAFAVEESLPAGAVADLGSALRAAEAPVPLFEAARPIVSSRLQDPRSLPLNLSLESWTGTVCVKGAWTLRYDAPPSPRDHHAFVDQVQVSPAVLADGARVGPGIGASARF